MRPVHSNEEKEFSSGPNNYTQAASPKLNGGSGLKEIVRRDEKYKEKHVTMVSKTASSPRSCEMVKEATSNWDMVKNMGINFSKQEGTYWVTSVR